MKLEIPQQPSAFLLESMPTNDNQPAPGRSVLGRLGCAAAVFVLGAGLPVAAFAHSGSDGDPTVISDPDNSSPVDCFTPVMKVALKHLGGENSRKWVVTGMLIAQGEGSVSQAGDSTSANPNIAILAAGFKVKSSVDIITIESKRRRGNRTAKADQTEMLDSANPLKIHIPFTTEKRNAIPDIGIRYTAPSETVNGCDSGGMPISVFTKLVPTKRK